MCLRPEIVHCDYVMCIYVCVCVYVCISLCVM